MSTYKFKQVVGERFHYWGRLKDGVFAGPVTITYARPEQQSKLDGHQYSGINDRDGKEIYYNCERFTFRHTDTDVSGLDGLLAFDVTTQVASIWTKDGQRLSVEGASDIKVVDNVYLIEE